MINYKPNPVQLKLFSQLDEVACYQDCTSDGFFSVLVSNSSGKRQTSYPVECMPAVIDLLDPNLDTWISQASFYKRNRRVVNLKSVGLSFLDIDCYKLDWSKNLSAEQMATQFVEFCRLEGIPVPSLIVYSGRGLQPKWLFTKAIPRLALPRWNAVQKQLLKKLQPYGADPLARDASRVLRLVETVNTKSGNQCHVVWIKTDADGAPQRYDFDEFANIILPFTRQEIHDRQLARQDRVNAYKYKTVAAKFSADSLNWARLEDLRILVSLRDGVEEGQRMMTLFMQMNFMALSDQIDLKTFFMEAKQLAYGIDPTWKYLNSDLSTLYGKFKDALNGKKVLYNGVKYTPLYTPKNQTLIDWFEITDDEMRHLKTIISADMKQERNTRLHRVARQADGAMPRVEYENRSDARKERARELRKSGLSMRQIADEMKMSLGAIANYLKK